LDVVELAEIFEALGVAPEASMKEFLQHSQTAHGKRAAKLQVSV
jgi:hypothetical protein